MKGRDVARAYAGILAASALGVAFGYLLRMLFSRHLTQYDFGAFYATIGAVGVFSVFMDPGISRGLVRFVSRSRGDEKRKYFWASVILQFIPSAAVMAAAITLSQVIAAMLSIPSRVFILGVASFVILPIYRSFASFLQAEEMVVASKMVETERIFLSTVFFLVLLSIAGGSAFTAMLSYVLAAVATTASFIVYPGSHILLPSMPDARHIKTLLVFSLPIALSTVATTIFMNLDDVMISFFRGPVEVSLYETARPIASLVTYLLFPASLILYPEISRKGVEGSVLSSAIVKMVILVSVPAVAMFILYPEIFLRIMFGEKFVPASPALSILSISVFFWSLFGINSSIILGLGRSDIPTKVSMVFGFANVVMDLFFIPVFGFVGASITTTLAAILSFLATFYYLRERRMYSISNILPPFISSLPPIAAVAAVKSLQIPFYPKLALSALVFSLVYAVSIKLTGAIKRHEAESLPVIGRYVSWLSA